MANEMEQRHSDGIINEDSISFFLAAVLPAIFIVEFFRSVSVLFEWLLWQK